MIQISADIFTRFPHTQVAFSLVRGVVTKSNKGPHKNFLSEYKQDVVKQMAKENITKENYEQLPVCLSWNRVFQTFDVANDKQSTINNLLRRAATEAEKMTAAELSGAKPYRANMGQISDPVDFYNCVSIETKTPMGAVLKSAVKGPITLRYGKEDEQFIPLGKVDEIYKVTPEHIVYADDESILTWLWNYRDAKHCSVPSKSAEEVDVIIFADQADKTGGDAKGAIDLLNSKIHQIGWKVIKSGILNSENPVFNLDQKD